MPIAGEMSPAVHAHLLTVYATILVAIIAATLGASMHVVWYPGGVVTWVGILGGLGLIKAAPARKNGERVQMLSLIMLALWEGFSVGPGIRMSLCCFPLSIIVTVLMGAAVTYGCFVGAAIVSQHRNVLVIGGLVASVVSFLVWLRFAFNIYGPYVAHFRIGVYTRVVVFVIYFIYDTQQILWRAHEGDMDHVRHAKIISGDFLAVLAPLLVILVRVVLRDVSFYDAPTQGPNAADMERVKRKRSAELGLHFSLLLGCALVSFLFE